MKTISHSRPLQIPQSLKIEVDERDGGVCQRCGAKGTERHHIVFGMGLGRRKVHTIENLITLCHQCHVEAHTRRLGRKRLMAWSRERYGNTVDLIKQYGHLWREYATQGDEHSGANQ